jgi:hypothetical protein
VDEEEGLGAMPRDPEEARQITYQVRRYMDHLSDKDLEQRAKDIFFNRAVGAPADLLAHPPPMGWDYLWRDVVDEAQRRFGDVGARAFGERVAKQCYADWQTRQRLPRDQAAAFLQRVRVGSDFLVRYSKRRYLEEFVSRGYLEIRPASSYNDPSLNPGVRDDELRLAIQPNPSEIRLEVIDRTTGQVKGRLEPVGSRLTTVAPTDYYVYCMSGLLSPDLFHDFGADACVLIRDLKVFQERLLEGLNSRLPYPTWGGQIERVQYVDPLNTTFRQFHVYYAKHFRYAYQQEYRVVWCPAATTPIVALDVIRLELGAMRDCCELLCP